MKCKEKVKIMMKEGCRKGKGKIYEGRRKIIQKKKEG